MSGAQGGGSVEAAPHSQGPGPVAETVARVEAELAKFWSTPYDTNGDPAPKTRASTMNFVAIGSHAEVERIEAQAEDIADTHAGRTFLLMVDGRLAPWELKADWSASCRRDGDVPICRDRVDLTFGAMAAERAASVVSALSISDVPVIVEIAAGAPPALADAMAGACDRLIVDSAETSIPRIVELVRRSTAPIADRAFVRTFSWREFIARFFDDATDAWKLIRRVEIGRSEGQKPDPAAPLLGWLASRLGWTFEARDRALDAEGKPIEIALVDTPAADDGGRRRLDSVRLWTSFRDAPLSLACVRSEGASGTVQWTVEGALSTAHSHPIGHRDEAWVLVKAIDAMTGDRPLREALLAAAAWCAL